MTSVHAYRTGGLQLARPQNLVKIPLAATMGGHLNCILTYVGRFNLFYKRNTTGVRTTIANVQRLEYTMANM